MILVGDRCELESADDAGSLVSGLSGDDLVPEGVLGVGDLIDAQLPNSAVSVREADNGVKLVWGA